MQAFRLSTIGMLLGLGVAAAAQAQLVHRGGDPWPSTGASGLSLAGSAARYPVGCGASLLPCSSAAEAAFQGRSGGSGLRWALELSQFRLAGASGPIAGAERQGLNLSLVGRQPLFGSAFSVYGKLGTTYGYSDFSGSPVAAPAAFEAGYGLSFGAGVSMEVTRRLSATLGWETHDLRLGGGSRDNVRSTNLGLQYRY